jgi:TonB family protein
MRGNDNDKSRNTRIESPGDEIAGIVQPHRVGNTRLFPGWGPKLLAVAIAVSSFSQLDRNGAAAAATLAAPSCAADRSAQIIGNPDPRLPEIARQQGVDGSVVIRVGVSAMGLLENASVAQSSGNSLLDEEALRVARRSQYAPAVHDCRAIAGAYLYVVSFDLIA